MSDLPPPPLPPGGGYPPGGQPPGGYPPQPPGGGWGPPGYPQYQGQPPSQPQTNGKAIASLVLGIVSFVLCCLGLVTAVIGIILAVQARKEIDASGGRQTGQGLATAGLVCSIINLAAAPIWFFLWTLGSLPYGYY